ncbi:hypothetical protein B0H14DRAFT_2566243 [Mycena olivaceomarginata]|nr:hypothetical protein B0H14DRAFT_2566243 [Mycena olivaceomarginata]
MGTGQRYKCSTVPGTVSDRWGERHRRWCGVGVQRAGGLTAAWWQRGGVVQPARRTHTGTAAGQYGMCRQESRGSGGARLEHRRGAARCDGTQGDVYTSLGLDRAWTSASLEAQHLVDTSQHSARQWCGGGHERGHRPSQCRGGSGESRQKAWALHESLSPLVLALAQCNDLSVSC